MPSMAVGPVLYLVAAPAPPLAKLRDVDGPALEQGCPSCRLNRPTVGGNSDNLIVAPTFPLSDLPVIRREQGHQLCELSKMDPC